MLRARRLAPGHPKSRRFAEASTLARLKDRTAPDVMYSDYYLDGYGSALEESRLFFAELLRGDLPARNAVVGLRAERTARRAPVSQRQRAQHRTRCFGHCGWTYDASGGELRPSARPRHPCCAALDHGRIFGQKPPPPPLSVPRSSRTFAERSPSASARQTSHPGNATPATRRSIRRDSRLRTST